MRKHKAQNLKIIKAYYDSYFMTRDSNGIWALWQQKDKDDKEYSNYVGSFESLFRLVRFIK